MRLIFNMHFLSSATYIQDVSLCALSSIQSTPLDAIGFTQPNEPGVWALRSLCGAVVLVEVVCCVVRAVSFLLSLSLLPFSPSMLSSHAVYHTRCVMSMVSTLSRLEAVLMCYLGAYYYPRESTCKSLLCRTTNS